MFVAPEALELDETAMRRMAAREAIQKVRLLSSTSEDVIVDLLDNRFQGQHPKAICTAYRKEGEQLSKAELKALGLRSNAFLSKKAFNEMSMLGLDSPLVAHEITLLRAWFTLTRWRNVISARRAAVDISQFKDQFKYDTTGNACKTCEALDGKIVKAEKANIFPPQRCNCETANYSLVAHIDWLADLD